MAVPTRDSELLPYALNFSDRVTATPSAFSLVAADATALSAVVTPYQAAMVAIARAGGEVALARGDQAQREAGFVIGPSRVVHQGQGSLAVTDANKSLLGVRVKKTTRTPLSAPSSKPAVHVKSVDGFNVTITLHDSADAAQRKASRLPGR